MGFWGWLWKKLNRATEYIEIGERIKTTKKLKKVKTRKAGFRLCLFYSKTRAVSPTTRKPQYKTCNPKSCFIRAALEICLRSVVLNQHRWRFVDDVFPALCQEWVCLFRPRHVRRLLGT